MLVRGTGIELGLPTYLGDQASALREAGSNYESAVCATVTLGLMKRGRYWRCGCWIKATHGRKSLLELGVDKQPGAGNQIRLVDLDEGDRELLMAEAREQVKGEYGLGQHW
jgi:hypothetical protein